MLKFAAKLLFQFRVKVDGQSNLRRTCEERIIHTKAIGPEEALENFKKYAKSEEHKYKNNEGNWVFFEFVGVMDMMHLGTEATKEEVWYEIKEYLTPKERRKKLIPEEKNLHAFKEFYT